MSNLEAAGCYRPSPNSRDMNFINRTADAVSAFAELKGAGGVSGSRCAKAACQFRSGYSSTHVELRYSGFSQPGQSCRRSLFLKRPPAPQDKGSEQCCWEELPQFQPLELCRPLPRQHW
jgi:hypothetical protein